MLDPIQLKAIPLPNGELIGYREAGNGQETLLLIHGNNASSKHWDILMESLLNDYTVIAVDLRGFGISTYDAPIRAIKDFADDLYAFVSTLNLKDFTIAGWSMGGAVAMSFLVNYPDYAKKLILIESIGIKGYPVHKKDEKDKGINEEYLVTEEDLVDDSVIKSIIDANKHKDRTKLKDIWCRLVYNFSQPNKEQFERYLDDMLTQRNLDDVYDALHRFNISKEPNGVVKGTGEVDHINIPTLVIHGEEDLVIPIEAALELKDALGHLANLVVFKNCGHSPLVDALEELVFNIKSFINNTSTD
ncbi:alpha/beta hydrolase [Serpentinicella sp. ANB-PHB4]|uniref:intracellular short-chain-length polyhydroxyalkanoate depolymerase n=1 Tax=Serpentinicella sp. ANB-PHB4 TaxID=3074076 RepID=UPI002861F020|nr:alpha/beta hydrolase [Serpentinicella sp. ANB-PHB4]MDR5658639.1 alpha/beta hydrolase [Serpentinicella sp. ANB-PHB4]